MSFVSVRTLSRRLLHVWLSLFIALGPASLQAATYYVSESGSDGNSGTAAEPFATISHAIEVAASNSDKEDTIYVLPGLYDTEGGESFPMEMVEGVVLQSTEGPAQTTISAPAGTPVFDNNDFDLTPATILDGFTLRHDDDPAPQDDTLIWFTGSGRTWEPVIRNNVFVGQGSGEPDAMGDAGILADAGDSSFGATIENNTFTGFGLPDEPYFNIYAAAGAVTVGASYGYRGTASTAPAAIEPGVPAIYPTITGNLFEDNGLAVGIFAIEAVIERVTPLVDSNTFRSNSVDVAQLTVVLSPQYAPVVSNNTSTGSGAGILMLEAVYPAEGAYGPPTTTVERNRIEEVTNIGIGASSGSLIGEAPLELNVQSNHVSGADVGLYLANAGFFGSPGSTAFNVAGNTVGGNVTGMETDINSSGTAVSVTVESNVFSQNSGTGAKIGFDTGVPTAASSGNVQPDAVSAVTISSNLFQNNGGIGLDFAPGDSEPAAEVECNTISGNGGDGMVVRVHTGPSPDLGTEGDHGNNSLYGNGDPDGTYDLRNEDEAAIMAVGNYWGSTSGIDARIYDDEESGNAMGPVNFDEALATSTTDTCIAATAADLDVTKTAAPSSGPPGTVLTYTVTVTNNGPATATDVVVTDPLPDEVTFVSADAGCTHSLGTVTCEAGNLEDGESASFEISVRVNQGVTGSFENTAYAVADEPDTDADSTAGASFNATVAAPAEIPTASEWGLIAMTLMLSLAGLLAMRRGSGLWLVLILALAGTAAFAPEAGASTPEKATLVSATVRGDQVVLEFEGRAPITVAQSSLRVTDLRAFGSLPRGDAKARPARSKGAKPQRILSLGVGVPELAGVLAAQGGAGLPVVVETGDAVRVKLMSSPAHADRHLAFRARVADAAKRRGGAQR